MKNIILAFTVTLLITSSASCSEYKDLPSISNTKEKTDVVTKTFIDTKMIDFNKQISNDTAPVQSAATELNIDYEKANGSDIQLGLERKIDPQKPMIALTFDDGPNSKTTIPILDTLKSNDAVATFFVLGNRVPKNKAILIRMISEGNEIGNHSYNHKQLTTLTPIQLKDQISKTQAAIKAAVGIFPNTMRPTYGSTNNNVKEYVNMPLVLWSIDTRDWQSKNPKSINKLTLDKVKDGDIILMHDIYATTAEAVKELIPALVARGFQLVTVSELYHARGKSLQAGNIYNKIRK